jgi:hypothetical protein
LLTACPVAESTAAQPSAPVASTLTLKTNRVIVFKDGYCLVIKQGTATTDAHGIVFTDEVPDAAVLGSFWAVPENGTLDSVVAGWVETQRDADRNVDCSSVIEIVEANLGKDCTFAIDEQKFAGNLHKILRKTPTPLDTLDASIARFNADYFVLRTSEGDKMIQASAVQNLTIKDMLSSFDRMVTEKSRHKRLTMKFDQPNTSVRVNLMYFRPDVRWIPTYRVNLTGEKIAAMAQQSSKPQQAGNSAVADRRIAEIIMQGEILNEAEDLVDVPFHLVVGVPNFRFRTVPSPMVLEATMRNLLSQAAPNVMGVSNQFSNAMFTQRSGELHNRRSNDNESSSMVELPDELIGKSGNDLFVYELPPMTLRKGERAIVPILRTEAAYRDIYTWDIELTHAENYAASAADSTSPLVLSETRVWRQVELINNTKIPWTTGAAMFVDGQQPLAQELLTYTSPGGTCRVPVTVSVDLQGKAIDTEVKREFNVLQWRGGHYALVQGKIEIELANNKTESVLVGVRLRFGGKATKVSDEGKITLEAYRAEDWHERRGNPINQSSDVRWTTTLQPGERFQPLVDYEFYLQH